MPSRLSVARLAVAAVSLLAGLTVATAPGRRQPPPDPVPVQAPAPRPSPSPGGEDPRREVAALRAELHRQMASAGSAPAAPATSPSPPAGAPAPAGVPAGGPAARPGPAALPGRSPLVLGYYTEDWDGDTRAARSLALAGDRIDLVASFQYRLTEAGDLVGRPYPRLKEQVAEGVPVLALFHNYAGDGFDQGIARAVLADAAARERSALAVARTVREEGFAGTNIDLENIPPDLRGAFTDYVRRIAGKLRAEGRLVTISAPAKLGDEATNNWTGAFDYPALAPLVDLFVVMAYDEHLPGWEPGPIASPQWVRDVIRYAAGQVPPDKLLLGVPQYAYDWIEGTTQGRGLSSPAALELARRQGVRVLRAAGDETGFFRYTDAQGRPRVVYVEDHRSLAQKLDLARQHGLRGVALWRLGLEDPESWDVIARYRR